MGAARRWLALALSVALLVLSAAQQPPGLSADAGIPPPAHVQIATTACGAAAAEDVIPLLKSIAIHSNAWNNYSVYVFMNNHTEFPFIKGHPRRSEFEAAHVDIDFRAIRQQNHSGLFKPCSTNRLYMPELLPEVDSLIYLDADVMAMTDLADLWRHFSHFNETQELAAAREAFQCGNASSWKWWYETCGGFKSWYPMGSWDDIVAPSGINAGVLLMNLTRLRATGATPQWDFLMSNRTELYLGDQDVLNIYYNHSIERLYLLPCRWNLRTDTQGGCPYRDHRLLDVPAEDLPFEFEAIFKARVPGVLHGNRQAFKKNGPYYGFAESVMAFNMSQRGDSRAVRSTFYWP